MRGLNKVAMVQSWVISDFSFVNQFGLKLL